MSLTVWAVILVLILINALYVAAEFGAVGVRRSRVRRMSEDGNWLARALLPFINDPANLDRYVAVSQIGITLSSLVLGAYAQATIAVSLAPRLVSWFSLEANAAESWAAIGVLVALTAVQVVLRDRKSTRLNSSHSQISYAVFCLKKKIEQSAPPAPRTADSLPLFRARQLPDAASLLRYARQAGGVPLPLPCLRGRVSPPQVVGAP